ncbi:MAG TPA: response regulator [Burkholderiaceae bacterium]|nr:response regulator [Burkholderiaceae bacterium]
MPFTHSVCLLGFSDFERRALAMQFGLASARNPSYALVATPQEARFLVVDADAKTAVQRALDAGRLADALFVGSGAAPAGALARLKRPIDALSLLRELDAAVLRVQGPAAAVLAAAPAKPAMAPTAAPIAVPPKPAIPLQRRTLPLARPPQSAGEPGGTVPGLLDSQLSELADLFPDRAPANGDASQTPAKEIRCDALLVDDSEIALRFLEIKLGELGLRSRTATDSDAALEQLSQHEFKYVFLDVELGTSSRMDGLALCRHIKRMRRTNRPPVVAMVSAHATQTDRVRGSLAGCDAYLGKPLVADELRAVVGMRTAR